MLPFLTGWPKHLSLGPDEQETAGALISSLLLMTWFVEARDPYTGGTCGAYRATRACWPRQWELRLPTWYGSALVAFCMI
jgi:hypothetical protein